MLSLLIVVILFHILVLIQIIPYTIVWAGKIDSVEKMRAFELLSIAINIFLITTLLLKGNYINTTISVKVLNGIIWLFVILFSLNTIGNLFSKTNFELFVFTPLTFVSALLCWRIVVGKR